MSIELSKKLQNANLKESEIFSPFTLIWLSRPSPNNWLLWLTLKAEEIENYKNKMAESGGNIDGAILIKGNENVKYFFTFLINNLWKRHFV